MRNNDTNQEFAYINQFLTCSSQPTTLDGKVRLVEELKNRAKGCIGSRNFPVAVQLYTKAIEVIPQEDAAGAAVLRANRSMCYLSIGNASSAFTDAEEAEKLDSTYLKVYYRKAAALKALGRFSEAKSAIWKGLEFKADDKDMKALLVKIEADIVSQGSAKPSSSVPPARTTISTSTTSQKSSSSSSATAKPAPAASKTSSSSAATADDDDEDEAALGNVRGYKKTADGRTTTFFNNELDETAKRLIGDIAPKKLEAEMKAPESAALANGSSVWNSAGTYEERILTPWATSELKERLSALAGRVEQGGANMDPREWAGFANGAAPLEAVDISVTEVESVTGDAQVSMTRGKKKHLCDYCVDLKWALTLKHAGSEEITEVVAGKLSVLDISADKEYEVSALEVTHFNGQPASQSVLPLYAGLLFNTFVKKSSSAQPRGLQRLVHDALMRFCDDFKTK